MGDVIPIRIGKSRHVLDSRRAEANQLRDIIEKRPVNFRSGESGLVAGRLDQRIGRHAQECGRRVNSVCRDIWPEETNPAKRRRELRSIKKATKLREYADRIAHAIGADADDLLLEAFRDTHFDEKVAARMTGRDSGTNVEDCWRVVSDTLHKLAMEVTRTEGLADDQRRLVMVQGRYVLEDASIRTAGGPLLYGPLASWSVHYEEYPPIPSVVLFREPKSDTVECPLTVDATGETLGVQVTVFRDVRLAIGPADDVSVPKPLFEFRSVLDLVGPEGPIRVLRPWHDLAGC